MAGVTDRPFRQLCRELGAGLAVSEMITSNPALYKSRKTQLRLNHVGESSPIAIQIAGADPKMMADAARFNVDHGAQIIDINMGCPAKKVCNVQAGSALLKNEKLVQEILSAVVEAVPVPVTLKIRTGWDREHRNALEIARLAEQVGIQGLAVHGRTRACGFNGEAEYETIAKIKSHVAIPVIANGDICSPQMAAQVLSFTKADGLMIGRAAQGRPWIFRQIQHYLLNQELLPEPSLSERRRILLTHLERLYDFYGEYMGVRIARKHIGWYCRDHDGAAPFRALVNQAEACEDQLGRVKDYFDSCEDKGLAA